LICPKRILNIKTVMNKPTLKHINKILNTDLGGDAKVTKQGIRTIKLWKSLKLEAIQKLKESLPLMFPEQIVSFTQKTVTGACTKPVTAVIFTPKSI